MKVSTLVSKPIAHIGGGGAFNNSLTYGGVNPCVGIALEGSAADRKIRILLK